MSILWRTTSRPEGKKVRKLLTKNRGKELVSLFPVPVFPKTPWKNWMKNMQRMIKFCKLNAKTKKLVQVKKLCSLVRWHLMLSGRSWLSINSTRKDRWGLSVSSLLVLSKKTLRPSKHFVMPLLKEISRFGLQCGQKGATGGPTHVRLRIRRGWIVRAMIGGENTRA